jgi:hypothetical protein
MFSPEKEPKVSHLLRRWHLSTLLLVAALSACNEPAPLPFAVEFLVQGDEDQPVAGAMIAISGKPAGASNASGQLELALQGFEGDRLKVSLTCPTGWISDPEESMLILRTVQSLGAQGRRAVSHGLRCKPTKREAVVVVHIEGASNLPVAVDGNPALRTDEHGFAHIYVNRDPNSRIEVTLDTSENEKLLPQNPKRVFELGDQDSLFVFEQAFKLPKPKPKPKKPKPKVHIPTRLN